MDLGLRLSYRHMLSLSRTVQIGGKFGARGVEVRHTPSDNKSIVLFFFLLSIFSPWVFSIDSVHTIVLSTSESDNCAVFVDFCFITIEIFAWAISIVAETAE